MPPFCHAHNMYHDLRYPHECSDMRARERREALAAKRRERAERIADNLIDAYADATDRPDDLQLVRGLLAEAALAALTEKEAAR